MSDRAFVLAPLLSLALAGAAACDPPAERPVQAAPPAPAARPAARIEPDPGALRSTVERVSELATDPRTLQLSPEELPARLIALADMRPGARTPAVRQFLGRGTVAGLHWVQVDFQPGPEDAAHDWSVLQIRFGLAPADGDLPSLYENLREAIAGRLGSAGEPAPHAGPTRRAWSIAGDGEVSVEIGEFESPFGREPGSVVLLAVAVPQGEAEE